MRFIEGGGELTYIFMEGGLIIDNAIFYYRLHRLSII